MFEINMDDTRLVNINQIKEFLKASQGVALSLAEHSIDEKYEFVDQTIDRLSYSQLARADKRTVINYLKKVTGYKRAQLFRLIKKSQRGKLKRKKYTRKNPNRRYLTGDIKLLEKTDELHVRLNAKTTKEILRREYEVFGREGFENISQISPSHINNLRKSPVYRNHWVNHTKARQVPIGVTQPPESYGRPGSLRVDTVHQRDVYHVNSVDEITQWEIVVCVPQLTEEYMLPALEALLDQYPFLIFNFHSDRGGETINHQVADWLHGLLIKQTKNRARHPNDNALVETKNGAVIRKNMGWYHIHKELVEVINKYYHKFFNPYLNFHRPCLYPTEVVTSSNGLRRKVYNQVTVPYEKLKEVSRQKKQNFLKPGLTFDILDQIAYNHSDNEFAEILRREESILFDKIMKIGQKHDSRRK